MEDNIRTILILASNPKDTPRLRLDEEIREIENGLKRSKKRDKYKLEPRLATRQSDVRRAMLDYEPRIVHFCGHCEGENGIILEDEMGNAKIVNPRMLAELFEIFAYCVNCVVLNACYSDIQAQAIAQYVDYVIGMNNKISDKVAIDFSVAFYDALGAGKDIEFAFTFACIAIEWASLPKNLTPVLIMRKKQFKKTPSKNLDKDNNRRIKLLKLSPYATRIVDIDIDTNWGSEFNPSDLAKPLQANVQLNNENELEIRVLDYFLKVKRDNSDSFEFRGLETWQGEAKEFFFVYLLSNDCNFNNELYDNKIHLVKIAKHTVVIVEFDKTFGKGIEYNPLIPGREHEHEATVVLEGNDKLNILVSVEEKGDDGTIKNIKEYKLSTTRTKDRAGSSCFKGIEIGPDAEHEFDVYVLTTNPKLIKSRLMFET